ncbi:adenylyl-sulfate kinase [Candidatus Poribacteria bacterium]|nr:adenylyl-sulfate kinase [Candidatus Poribacteria bacterium]
MTKQKATNITWHHAKIAKEDRENLLGHKGAVLWFTGLSASGKSTVANEVERILYERQCLTYVLDGDNIRHGLNKDLGFSPEDREENIRRIGEVARLFANAGLIAMTAFISPYRADRNKARELMGDGQFIEIYVDCPVDVCEERDPKGLYEKAKKGEIKEFTGISAPYEPPENPEIVLNTAELTVEESAQVVISFLEARGIVPKKE